MASTSVKDAFNRAKELQHDEVLEFVFKTPEKAKSFRAMFYKEKKINNEEELVISIKGNKLSISKEKEQFISFVRVKNKDEDEREKVTLTKHKKEKVLKSESEDEDEDEDGIPTINIDPTRVKTIRERLSYYDSDKQEIAKQYIKCKSEIESDEELSQEDKEFLTSKIFETLTVKMDKLNKLSRALLE